MKTKELNEFTQRMLLALKTAQHDRDRDAMGTIIDTLAQAHGIPATYPPVA
jgi:hypothetical protein